MRKLGGRFFWGAMFLLGAVLLTVSQLDLITYHFTFWGVVATLFLMALLVTSLWGRSITGTVFSLAFLALIYATPLGISQISPWAIMGIAVLVIIGLQILLRPVIYRFQVDRFNRLGQNFSSQAAVEEPSQEGTKIRITNRMSQSIRYVQSENLNQVDIDNSLGDVHVYFDDVYVENTLVINLNVSMGGVTLFIPQNWQIINEVNAVLGGIDDQTVATDTSGAGGGPKKQIHVRGRVSLSGVSIRYLNKV